MADILNEVKTTASKTMTQAGTLFDEAWTQTKQHSMGIGLTVAALAGTAAVLCLIPGEALEFGSPVLDSAEGVAGESPCFSLLTRNPGALPEVRSYNGLTQVGRVVGDSLGHTVQLRIAQTSGGPELGISGSLIEAGSGVIVREDGVVATCAHNLRTSYPDIPVISRNLSIRLPNTNEWRAAHVLVKDEATEMALLAIEKTEPAETFNAVKLAAPGAQLKKGTDVFALGHPLPDIELAVSPGYVHSIEHMGDTLASRKAAMIGEDLTRPLIRFDANIAQGNSGGGLFAKKDGSLLGIVGKGDSRFEVGWAYPSSDIQNLLSKLTT